MHLFFLLLMFVFAILHVCFLQPCGHLLEKGWPFDSSVCDVFLCFCHFPIWSPLSCVVLDFFYS